MCFLASAIEIAKFREALEHLVINDITYFNHSPESTAHDYLIRYRTGFMTLWKDGSCTGGGCSTPDCTEDPLHFQAVYCPMDTNFQAYVETLLESADTDSTDDTVMECRNRLIAEGEEPLHPQDAVPVADPYGNVNSWCRIRDTLIESPLTSITMCVWTASLLAGMQMLAVTAVSIVELTDRLKLSDLFKKPRTMTELTNGNRQQARSDAVVDQV
ncbi:hypothetical protein FOL47_008885 [Perkinsus chesapeaki]|uniref:Uncharacterized protein n=1 Tax=Perkinsus chesapeaki TaxID=330153 RepID=A0A7J6LB93_PERCH|nr:hypothetical protein FOL47_008885 [Perkinsus chesapeaki]